MEISNVGSNNVIVKKEKKNNTALNTALASTVAMTAGASLQTTTALSNLGVVDLMSKHGAISQDKIDLLHKKAEEALKNVGLDKKGVKITYIPESKVKSTILESLGKQLEQIRQGKNAAFVPQQNKIFMPEKGISFAAFHEIGHAHNYNFSKVGKFLQKMRIPGMILAGGIAMLSAFTKTSKPENGEDLSAWQKTKNFIRNNAGKLSFAAMIPMLSEEAIATIKGHKMVKGILPPDMYKHVTKGNRIAYMSYLLSALSLSLGAYATTKIKDKLTSN